jgi:hypothetical protein
MMNFNPAKVSGYGALLGLSLILGHAGVAQASHVRGRSVSSVNRSSVNRSNVNRNSVNRSTTVNRNQNVNVNVNRDVDVHGHGGYYGGCCYHPVARAAAVTATVAATAVVVGSIVSTLPPNCTTIVANGVSYRQCGSTWYQPQISGSSTTYVVVNPPH